MKILPVVQSSSEARSGATAKTVVALLIDKAKRPFASIFLNGPGRDVDLRRHVRAADFCRGQNSIRRQAGGGKSMFARKGSFRLSLNQL